MSNYVEKSLETHLFFARIMKEHSLFLQAGFQMPGRMYMQKADWYRKNWEQFLRKVVQISNGIVEENVLCSGEVVTEYTMGAEGRTSQLTGIPIDRSITEAQHRLRARDCECQRADMLRLVRRLNNEALSLLAGLIELKECILAEVNICRLYTANYPLLIEHIIREAKLYYSTIAELNENGELSCGCQKEMEAFWNQIMMEHALFIRGLLDPTEEELIETADGFAKDYKKLLEDARMKDCQTMDEITRQTIEETMKYRDFKAAGTKGITNCEISSIILPLLADHVLREANHYLRILMRSKNLYDWLFTFPTNRLYNCNWTYNEVINFDK